MRIVTTTLAAVLAIGMTCTAWAAAPATQPVTPAWVSKPTTAWPPILVTNRLQTAQGVGFSGSAGFARLPNGVVVLMTAHHLLEDAKLADFKTAFKSWTAVAVPGSSAGMRMPSVAMDTTQEPTLDTVILLPAGQGGPWPATVLTVRQEPLQEGETVYLVGIPAEPGKGRQSVHKGIVTAILSDKSVVYTVEGTFPTTGNSGAPVVDSQGRLAMINTSHFNKQDDPGHMVLAGIATADVLPLIKLPPGMKPLVLTAQPAAATASNAPAGNAGGKEAEAEKQLEIVEAVKGQLPPDAVSVMLMKIIQDYPGTAAAKKAQQKLGSK